MPPSAPADHLACSEKPSASWRQRGGLAACGAALVFLASIHGDRGSGEKPCAAIGQGAAGRDDARGRPAAFRSAARPAAPGALMPTTAGFVVDEDGTGFSCLTWRFESRAQHTGQCAPRSLPARLGDLSPTSARRPHAHHQRAATAAHRARRLSALLTTRRRCPQACEAERRPHSARGCGERDQPPGFGPSPAQRRRGPGSSPGGGPGGSRSLRRPHPVRDQGVRSLKLQGPSARPRPPRPARSHILRSAAAAALSLSLPALPSRAHRRRARAPPQAAGLTLVPVPLLRRQHPRSCGPHDQLPARAALAVARRLRRRLVRQGDEEHHQA